jgi:lycopene cyclase domain-containing protein
VNTNYLYHLLGWMLPIAVVQWFIGWRIFWRNLRAVIVPTLAIGTYFTLADSIAIHQGIWKFDRNQILGLHLGLVPVEEVIFFYLTSLLVSQSLVLFLPEKLRS